MNMYTARPFLVGTSNARQGDRFGWMRLTNTPYHRKSHECCNATTEADFLNIASIPGLSMKNINRHTVPHGTYGGKTIIKVLETVTTSPEFDGNLCFWFLDNDLEFIAKYRNDAKSAVEKYYQFLNELFNDFNFKMLYIITAPLRKSDFQFDRKLKCFPHELKQQFNKTLCDEYKNKVNTLGNGIPFTLIDLNEIWPESEAYQQSYYCTKEKDKVHYNKTMYVKFLSLLKDKLNENNGISQPVVKRKRGKNKKTRNYNPLNLVEVD